MKHKILPALLVLKVVILSVWIISSWDFRPVAALAEAPQSPDPAIKKKETNQEDEKDKGLIAAVLRRQKELDAREEEIKVREERLLSIKKDVDAKIAELNKAEGRIEAFVKKIDEVNEDRIKKVVKIYEAMTPEEAASRIEKLDERTAVMILSSMSDKKAAKVLGLMEVGKSVRLSQSFKVKN